MLTLIGSALLMGCVGDSGPSANWHRQNGQVAGVHLDPSMPPAESTKVGEDLNLIRSLMIDGSRIKYFSDIFGGTDSASVERYFGERVHWILSSKKDLDQSVVPIADGLHAMSSNPQVVATNMGAAIWFAAMAQGLPPAGIQIGSDLVEIRSTRAGVIQLGDAYSSELANPLLRISTLIHEARHSDCTGGISRQDLALFKAKKEPQRRDCGHLHVDCPTGHDYAGFPACDDHGWGAYSVEADYMAAVARTCNGCSTRDQNMALLVFADAASRVIDLDGLLAGKLGPPDMSSSDTVFP